MVPCHGTDPGSKRPPAMATMKVPARALVGPVAQSGGPPRPDNSAFAFYEGNFTESKRSWVQKARWQQPALKVPSGPFHSNMAKKFDVGKHVFVPEHIKLSEKERDAVLAHYGIDAANMPKIKKKDPAIKSFATKQGDMIKIVRKSATAGTSIFYRVVINA